MVRYHMVLPWYGHTRTRKRRDRLLRTRRETPKDARRFGFALAFQKFCFYGLRGSTKRRCAHDGQPEMGSSKSTTTAAA